MRPLIEVAYRDGRVLAVAEKFFLEREMFYYIIYSPHGAGYLACHNDCDGHQEDSFLRQGELPDRVRLAFLARTKEGIEKLVKIGKLPKTCSIH